MWVYEKQEQKRAEIERWIETHATLSADEKGELAALLDALQAISEEFGEVFGQPVD